MSVGSIGSQGLSDDQAIGNWDPGVPSYQLSGAQTGTILSGAISCSAWASIAATCQLSVGGINFVLSWYANQALTNWMAQTAIFLDENIFQPMQMLVPNLGPWLQVKHFPAAAAPNFTPNTNVMLTNRFAPAFVVTPGVRPMNLPLALTPGATLNCYPTCYVSGKVSVFTTGGSQGLNFTLQIRDLPNTYTTIETWSVAAGAQDYRERILPGSAFRIVTQNQSGVNNNNTGGIQITSTMSGS